MYISSSLVAASNAGLVRCLIRTDTIDLLVSKIVHGTDGRDSDGATGPTGEPAQLYPWRRYGFADGGYAGAS